jgi:peptide/nickel transport system permease protein
MFVIRRVLISIPVLIASTILTFILVKMSGDPLQYLKTRNPRPSQHTIDLAAQRLYLNHSWPAQYWHWISNLVFHWSWGPASQDVTINNVSGEIGHALLVTLRLVIVAVLLSLILAVITGVVSAVKQYSVLDYTSSFFGFLFLSMPVFWFGILLKEYAIKYNGWTNSHTFSTIGERSIPITDHSFLGTIGDIAGHLVLPSIVLSLASYAAWSRFTRASVLEVLNSDYVRLARAKGLKRRRVLTRHALRTALIPLTTVSALDIAVLLGGAIITERVFQWNGMGTLFVTALNNRDYNLMLGWLLCAAVFVIAFNLIADLLYGVLDPRVRNA